MHENLKFQVLVMLEGGGCSPLSSHTLRSAGLHSPTHCSENLAHWLTAHRLIAHFKQQVRNTTNNTMDINDGAYAFPPGDSMYCARDPAAAKKLRLAYLKQIGRRTIEPSRELATHNQAHRPMSTAAILASMGYRAEGYNSSACIKASNKRKC